MKQENKVKGNTVQVGLINNSMTNNLDVNTNINTNINASANAKVKFGPLKLIEAAWGNIVLEYITNYEKKKQKCLETIKSTTLEKIPKEHITNPRINILGPSLDNLKYNLDEEHIKELFTNLLVNEMDDRKQEKIIPAYVQIISELDKEEAEFINYFHNLGDIYDTRMILIHENKNEISYEDIDYYTIIQTKNDRYYKKISKLSLDNLERLGIIKFDVQLQYVDPSGNIENDFNKIKNKDFKDKNIKYQLVSFSITDFGIDFSNICCS